ncbi:MFS transporter [Nocardia goodfellowii]|uniref:YNFM family putative membrane transporter n=1 Tax=Nocardia goodfellowii TaxID=882446 RepID=A0ABS4QRN8_9NOCA|nr:MFS transporter [Nocardia goodfellowii]MBP2194203.1 YNFM family putative membrane transporter [Nocardia goodfellowii]
MTTVVEPENQQLDMGYLPGSPGYRRVLVALFAAGMATFVLLYDTQALLPEFVTAFGISPGESTLVMSVTTAALALALLVFGPLSEAVGRTRLIHFSLISSAVLALACAFAPNWHALLALRLLGGIALAGLPAVATAYLREELHPSTHGRAAGLYIGGTALGGMAGRLVTAPIAEAAGWRWALVAAAGVALTCAVIVALILPASRHFVARPARPENILAMARGALSDRALLALYVIGACSVGALVAAFNALGFRLTSSPFLLGVGVVSLVYLVYPLGSIGSMVSGRLADRLGRRAIMPIGSALALVGVGLTLSDRLPIVVAGVAALTVGFFITHGLASGWVAARAHAGGASTSQAASFYLFAYYVGASVFGSLGAHAWTSADWHGVAALTAALIAVAGILALALRRIPVLTPAQFPDPS